MPYKMKNGIEIPKIGPSEIVGWSLVSVLAELLGISGISHPSPSRSWPCPQIPGTPNRWFRDKKSLWFQWGTAALIWVWFHCPVFVHQRLCFLVRPLIHIHGTNQDNHTCLFNPEALFIVFHSEFSTFLVISKLWMTQQHGHFPLSEPSYHLDPQILAQSVYF